MTSVFLLGDLADFVDRRRQHTFPLNCSLLIGIINMTQADKANTDRMTIKLSV